MTKPFNGETKYIENAGLQLGLTVPIGLLCVEWSLLEWVLASCFQLLVFGGDDKYDTSKTIVFDTFQSLVTFGTKKMFLLRAAKRRLDDKMVKRLNAILTTIESLQGRRNKIVHGSWSLPKDDTIKGFVWSNRHFAPLELYVVDDFTGLRNDLYSIIVKLHAFIEETKPLFKGNLLFQEMLRALIPVITGPPPENPQNAV